MPRFNPRRLRVRPREAAQIHTTERDVATVLGTLQGVWRNGTGRQAGGSLRVLARQIADDVSDWMSGWGYNGAAKATTAAAAGDAPRGG